MSKSIQEPQTINMRHALAQAYEELLRPPPSIQLPDWPAFNRAVGGFRSREFSILCGSTGSGKTTFLSNISAQLLKQGVKHFVMSVETGHTDFLKRVMSVFANQDLNTGEAIEPERIARIHTLHDKYLESDAIELSLYEDRVSVEQLLYDLRFMHEMKGCKVAMIDNLNFFMEVTRASDAIVEMDRVVHSLILLCKQLDIHVVMVMHPKKTDGEARVLSEFDIKGSSTAVQEAHNVFLFNRPSRDSKLPATSRELRIAKMRRRGRFVGHTIIFNVNATTYREAEQPWLA